MRRISLRESFAACGVLFVLASVFIVRPQTSRREPHERVSAEVREQIVQQLTRNGDLTAECLRDADGPTKVINIRAVDLNRDGKPEFIVKLLLSCGAGDGYAWIFRNTSTGLELLLSAGGPRTQISPMGSFTNGYRDIAEDAVGPRGGSVRTVYKFDGKLYKERK